MFRYETIYYADRMFLVKRKIREADLKTGFDTEVLKRWTMSDVLLRKDGFIYCCEQIQDAEIISES